MSVIDQIESITISRNAIRAKMIAAGQANKNDDLATLAANLVVFNTSDATATADDIVQGKTAYARNEKLTGTYVGIDTSDATATADDILEGKTAYADGEKITGEKLPITSETIKDRLNLDYIPEIKNIQFGTASLIEDESDLESGNLYLKTKLQYVDDGNFAHYVTVSKSGSNTYLPVGMAYIKAACSLPNNGTHSETCEGYTTGAGRPSSAHDMTYTLQGHGRATLYKRGSGGHVGTTTVLFDTYDNSRAEFKCLDPYSDYDVMLEAYGGSTIVTCPVCGYVKKFTGSYTIFFEAWSHANMYRIIEEAYFGIDGKAKQVYGKQYPYSRNTSNV